MKSRTPSRKGVHERGLHRGLFRRRGLGGAFASRAYEDSALPIGQEQTINIHVLYLVGSEYDILARWYHHGLDAFASIIPGAYELYCKFGEQIKAIALNRDLPALEKIIPPTRASCLEIAAQLKSGRDRLLELNSFNPTVAANVLDEIKMIEGESTLETFMLDIFEHFNWHASIGIDQALSGNKKFVSRMPNTASVREMFTAAGGDVLIHKTTRCLWKISDNKKSIEPVFSNDVLTDDEVKEAMGQPPVV